MKKEENKSLGFLFGFKDSTKNNDNSFTIKFKNGIATKFPAKYKNMKDFWSQEIFEGQKSDVYINPEVFKKAFELEISEINKDLNYFKQQFQERRYFFDYDITEIQYFSLTSFSMAHLHINPYEKWESDAILKKTLEETIGGKFTTGDRTILEIYNNYQETSEAIYNKETSDTLGNTYIENTSQNLSKPKLK